MKVRQAISGTVIAVILVLVPAASAAADTPPIVFDPKQTTVEYGESWQILVTTGESVNYSTFFTSSVSVHGAPKGYVPTTYAYSGSVSNTATAQVYPSPDARPLTVGSYSFDMSISGNYGGAWATASPQRFTVIPAALGIETRVVADPANPAAAVVSSRFTGDFVDRFNSTSYPTSPLTPPGSWHTTITDSEGGREEWTIDRTATDDVLAATFSWPSAKAGEQYTVATEFLPTGASTTNFTFGKSNDFTFTSPTTRREFASPDADPAAPLEPMRIAAFSVPVWWIGLAGLLVIALSSVLVLMGIRIRRTEPRTTRAESAHA